MTELLDNYCNATFPLDLTDTRGCNIRLIAAIGGKVVGVRWHGDTLETAWSTTAQIWLGNGDWDVETPGAYPTMCLPPPPALVDAQCAKYEAKIADYQARLDANPDAPEAWRKADEACIGKLQRMIAQLRPETLDQPMPG